MDTLQRQAPQDEQSDGFDRMVLLAVGVLFGFELSIILVIMFAAGASPRSMVLVVAVVIGSSSAALFLVTRLMWIPLQRQYPEQPVLEGAVSRSMQSFSFGGLARFNNALRITVDERHLHIAPFVLFSSFGARRISIPWDRIDDVRPAFWPGMLKATLDGRTISGPAWCLRLAGDQDAASSDK